MDQYTNQSEPSLQPDAYYMHGGYAAAGFGAWTAPGPGLVCLAKNCNFICLDEQSLNRHMQVHFPGPSAHHGTISPYTSVTYGATFRGYDPHNIAATDYTSMLSPTALSTATNNSGYAPSTITGGTSASLQGRLVCSHVGCTQTFSRPGDLDRHMKNHQAGPKDLDCPVRDCRKKGVDGFMRKDKLMDHLKAKHKW